MKQLFFYFFILVLTGCVAQNSVHIVESQSIYDTYKKIEDKPNDLHDLYLSYYLGEKRNEVLNLMNLGLYAYQNNYRRDAEFAFDKILLNFQTVSSEDDSAKKAKSLWHGEEQKRFIGEPYERSMVYYYRGLLFLDARDYENARASFKGGLLQDSRSEDQEYQADFKSLLLLDALSSKLNGDESLFEDSINELSKIIGDKESIFNVLCISQGKVNSDTETKSTFLCPENKQEEEKPETTKKAEESTKTSRSYMVLANSLNIREKPESGSKVAGKYKKDHVVEVVSNNNEWSQTDLGWVSNKFIKKIETPVEEKKEEIQPKNVDSLVTYRNIVEAIKNSNFFLFIETGEGPEKYTDGKNNTELKFREIGFEIPPKVKINNLISESSLLEDIYFQASTRGGREVDKIIQGKVAWKDETEQTSQQLLETGKSGFEAAHTFASNYNSSGNAQADAIAGSITLTLLAIGAVGTVTGKIAENVANSVVTEADSRYWTNLPGGIHLLMGKIKPGKYEVAIETYQDENNQLLAVDIPNDHIVIKHIFNNIDKPQGLINNEKISEVLSEKDKYHVNYLKSKEGNKVDETVNDSLSQFFNNLKLSN